MEKETIHQTRKFKVIADFPNSYLDVGDVFSCYYPQGRYYVTEDTKVNPLDYPHLFELLAEEV